MKFLVLISAVLTGSVVGRMEACTQTRRSFGVADSSSFLTPPLVPLPVLLSLRGGSQESSGLAGAMDAAKDGSIVQGVIKEDYESSSTAFAAVIEAVNVTASSEVASSSSEVTKKYPILTSLADRVLPAIGMLAFVGAIAYWGKEDGLIYLTLILQGAMYHEMTRVVGGDFAHPRFKWYWFAAASVAWNGPKMFPWLQNQINSGVASMTILGIITAILQFNYKGADIDEFRDFLRQAAVSFLSALLVVLPSSYWVAILENFGRKWVALPALLVIINDTMAYVFGKAMGKHKILPVISPSKTWEGFLGAALSTFLAAYFLLESKRDVLVFGSAVSLVGPFGGFLASLIKRAYLQKDFGTLFQGHGGFIDRLDCQLILAPLVFLYLIQTQSQ